MLKNEIKLEVKLCPAKLRKEVLLAGEEKNSKGTIKTALFAPIWRYVTILFCFLSFSLLHI